MWKIAQQRNKSNMLNVGWLLDTKIILIPGNKFEFIGNLKRTQ